MKKICSAALACVLCLALSLPVPAQAGVLEWYSRKTGESAGQTAPENDGGPQTEEESWSEGDEPWSERDEPWSEGDEPWPEEPGNGGTAQTQSGGSYAAGIAFREEKLFSPAMGAVVGKAVIPDGWSVQIQDLSLGSESVMWPNAVYVTVTSPAGDCILNYLSKRTFEQTWKNLAGYTYESEDDSFDRSLMMHMLDYRDAAGVCDLMARILYGGNPSLISELPIAQDRSSSVAAAKERFDTEIRELYDQVHQMNGGNALNVQWTDVTIAARTYEIDGNRAALTAISSGMDISEDLYGGSYGEMIYWNMECVYGMLTIPEMYESYQTVFDMFVSNTSVSQEYITMTDQQAAHLMQYFLMLQQGSGPTEEEESAALDSIRDDTVGSGDTYSAADAWSDVIREENDYITSDGSHIKLPASYDHVFEGDDGRIYAGSSVDGPAGSTELFPTQIGQ